MSLGRHGYLGGMDRRRGKLAGLAAAVLAGVCIIPGAVGAQTALPARPLGSAATAPPLPATPQGPVATVPVPDSVVRQANQQAQGNFTDMKRGAFGGQVQEAWDKAPATAGTHKAELCDGCAYKVRLREFMVTVIELPRGEKIAAFDNGDPEAFEVRQRGENRLAVKPVGGYGIDTNLLIYGKSGTIYPLYLRAEGFNSKHVPDLRFVIEGAVRVDKAGSLEEYPVGDDPGSGKGEAGGKSSTSSAKTPLDPALSMAALADASKAAGGAGKAKPGDFVEAKPFSPDKLRGWGQYKLWGNGDALKPETVFRDDYFTYVRFGAKWKDIELPTAYVVVDGIDEVVNTRVQGTTFIIESTQRLISLKSGSSFLCIQYQGKS